MKHTTLKYIHSISLVLAIAAAAYIKPAVAESCKVSGAMLKNASNGMEGWYDLIQENGHVIRFNLIENKTISTVSFKDKDGYRTTIIVNSTKV